MAERGIAVALSRASWLIVAPQQRAIAALLSRVLASQPIVASPAATMAELIVDMTEGVCK